MRVGIFGLGYVGTVMAACLARDGHRVIGVDVNVDKVAAVAAGEPPIAEAGLADLLRRGVASGSLTATADGQQAVWSSEMSIITVGTPPGPDGELSLEHVFRACAEIANWLDSRKERKHHVVVLRSTAAPGTLARCADIFTRTADVAHLAYNPEFLREGSAVDDFDNPPYTVVGTEDSRAEAALRDLYSRVDAPLLVVEPRVAEMVKSVANAWHATKIIFSNEVGRLAEASGVDGHAVMEIIIKDTKLNTSSAYMRPGFAYGGSCLPKDVGGLVHQARRLDVIAPLLSSLPVSNAAHVELAVEAVLRHRPKQVAVLGLAFKPGTDDLRQSPAVALIKRLIGEGCRVSVYDRHVRPDALTGTNLAYIRENLPHFEALLANSPMEIVEVADAVVVTQPTAEFAGLLPSIAPGKPVLDLAHGLWSTTPAPELSTDG